MATVIILLQVVVVGMNIIFMFNMILKQSYLWAILSLILSGIFVILSCILDKRGTNENNTDRIQQGS